MTEKPPYRVPTMEEIRALPWNGFNVISTFSGCGGSSLGYRMAGYRVLWASEFIDAARECYQANASPYTLVDGRDIRLVEPQEILEAINLQPGELDLLDGSPPCSSFSTAGKREEGWGKIKKYSDKAQRTDDLFFEFSRILRGIQPKVFVAENVAGLVTGSAKGYFIEIMRELKSCGYRVTCKVLDAQWLGVPQARKRTIFIGVREDLKVEPAHPKPLPYQYSVREAVPWIIKEKSSGKPENRQAADKPSGTIVQSGHRLSPTSYSLEGTYVEAETDISRFAIGKEWDKLKEGQQSDRYFNLVKPSRNQPSPTITASGGSGSIASVTHPTEKRKFSILELKRICAFPDDFILTGTYAQQWERLGRAVPPVMMKHIAQTIQHEILQTQQ